MSGAARRTYRTLAATTSTVAVALFRMMPSRLAYFLVRRSTPRYTLGVQVIVRRPDGRILLVQQTYRRLPFLPGGTLKRNESVLAGARRELREETGLDRECVPLGTVQVRHLASWATFYALAEVDDVLAEGARPASAEIRALIWADPSRLPDVDPGVLAAIKHVRSASVTLDDTS